MPSNWSFKKEVLAIALENNQTKSSIITDSMRAFTADFGRALIASGIQIKDGDRSVVGYDENIDSWFIVFKDKFFTVMLNRDVLNSSTKKTPFYFSVSTPEDVIEYKKTLLACPPVKMNARDTKDFFGNQAAPKKELMN
jgi:hypothetical protein